MWKWIWYQSYAYDDRHSTAQDCFPGSRMFCSNSTCCRSRSVLAGSAGKFHSMWGFYNDYAQSGARDSILFGGLQSRGPLVYCFSLQFPFKIWQFRLCQLFDGKWLTGITLPFVINQRSKYFINFTYSCTCNLTSSIICSDSFVILFCLLER